MSAKDDAKQLVNAFDALDSCPSAWSFMDRHEIAAGLKARIDNPDAINQSNTSLCGPADLIRNVDKDTPAVYAKAVIDLYIEGKASIGSFKIKPSSDLKKHPLASTAGIAQADWIILASIRDTDNWWFDYQSESDDVAAITMPHSKVTWLRKAGYSEIIDDTNVLFTKGIDNAIKASDLFARSYKVSLLINAQMLKVATQDSMSVFPDHWVALTSVLKRDDTAGTIEFTVYTWGAQQKVPLSGKLPIKSFLKNYYGYIACRR